ncbi:bromodomain adjacent to zinc finger domain protein 2A-like isoform X2 [Narcine bancroftii]|uniref:bromodomain adjacent to zinc finger domain protein 2A-like isoform X2 n=1 Tax=Narcine bancroftii TaxID=1343680 RepID=UPI0038319D1B
MEDQLHFACCTLTPDAADLSPSSYQEDGLLTNETTVSLAQPGRAMNSELDIKEVTFDCGATTSEAFPSAPSLDVEVARSSHLDSLNEYDFYWDWEQFQATNADILKEKVLLSQDQSNGLFEAAIKEIPVEPSVMPKALKQYDDRTNNSGSLDFDPYNFCSPHKIHFDMVQATPSFSPSPELTRIMVEEVRCFPYPFDHQYGQCNSQSHLLELEEADLDLFCSKEYEDVVGLLTKESESRENCNNNVGGYIESTTEEMKVGTSQDTPAHVFFSQSLENSLNFNIPLKGNPLDPALVAMMQSSSSHFTGEVNNKLDDCHNAEVKMSLEQDVPDFSLNNSTLAPSFENVNLFKSSLDETLASASLVMSPHTTSLKEDISDFDPSKGHNAAEEKIFSQLVMSSLVLSDIEGDTAITRTDSLASSTPSKKPLKEAQVQGAIPVPSTASTSSADGQGKYMRRRVTDESKLRIPLQYGWRREVRIRTVGSRVHGETKYYAPCGKRLRHFPDVIKYLIQNGITKLSREHFSFSPRMNVGDFFEMQEPVEGEHWHQLSAEEIPLRIQAMMCRRGRPPNSSQQWVQKWSLLKQGKGKLPKTRTVILLSNSDTKIMKKLEQQEVLSPKEIQTLKALLNKLKQKGLANKQKEDKMKEKKEMKRQQKLKQQRQQVLQEMKKPIEDLCLNDHKPLPEFNHIAGLVLSGRAFSDCLTVFEFLHTYGKVLEFHSLKDMPTLGTLQEGLLNVGDTMGNIQDLLIKLLDIVIANPGLPNQCQSVTLLNERICDIEITRNNVSEVLRIFLDAYGVETELCEGLKSKSFQAHSSEQKASVLAFLVNELLENSLVIREIDKNLYQRANIRKNKWIVDGKLRRLQRSLKKKKGFEKPKNIMEDRRGKRGLGFEVDLDDAPVDNGNEESVNECTKGKLSEKRNEGIMVEHEQLSNSVSELNCQIEKLSKRQVFFAQKLLQFSQKLRALLLGRDRFRRRYWVFPHLSGVFVEGSDELTATEEVITEMSELQHLEAVTDNEPSAKPSSAVRLEDEQKRKAVPESPKQQPANLRCCSDSQQEALSAAQPHLNLEQLAVFLAWLSVLQNSVSNLSIPTPQGSTDKDNLAAFSPEVLLASNHKLFDLSVPNSEQKVKDCAEKQGQWFSLLPRIPCDTSSITQLPTSLPLTLEHQSQRADSDPKELDCGPLKSPAIGQPFMETPYNAQFNDPLILDPACGTSDSGLPKASIPATKEDVQPPQSEALPQAKSTWPLKPKCCGQPSKFLKDLNQCQLMPIPPEMQNGWWHIGSLEELNCLLKALHPRGIREKGLQKQILKHMDYINQACSREKTDILFSTNNEEWRVTKEMVENWKPEKWAILADLEVLQYLKELEQRVILANLQVECLTSTDGRMKGEEEMELMRKRNNPLDLVVSQLAALELNIERRYLKEPLCAPTRGKWARISTSRKAAAKGSCWTETSSNEARILPGLSLWRETLLKCTNAAQVFMCIHQLEKSIAWEKSVLKVANSQSVRSRVLRSSSKQMRPSRRSARKVNNQAPEPTLSHTRGKQRRVGQCPENKFRNAKGTGHCSGRSRKRHGSSLPRQTPAAKRKRTSMINDPKDLALCEVILMEMESHEDAWPFLQPVNPRMVPGYRKIIKKPMDFSTIRGKLIERKYSSCKEFAADVHLVFDNCLNFNESGSKIGKAGSVMKKFFESRWAEFYLSGGGGASRELPLTTAVQCGLVTALDWEQH